MHFSILLLPCQMHKFHSGMMIRHFSYKTEMMVEKALEAQRKEISAIPKTQQESSELALEITSNAGCCHNLKP